MGAGADLRLLDKNAMTALDWAEEGEHVELAEFLSTCMSPVAKPSAVPTAASPASIATSDHTSVTAQDSENAFADANPIDEEHMTAALIWAAHHNELEKVQELLHLHTDVNVVDEV